MEIPLKLKEYIDKNCSSSPPVADPDEPLQLDSLGLVRLVAFLENEIGYRIEDEELIADNFATMRTIGELLRGKARGDLIFHQTAQNTARNG
jgi:acyl carrier protein